MRPQLAPERCRIDVDYNVGIHCKNVDDGSSGEPSGVGKELGIVRDDQ